MRNDILFEILLMIFNKYLMKNKYKEKFNTYFIFFIN